MKSGISLIVFLFALLHPQLVIGENFREQLLRQRAIDNGFVSVSETLHEAPENMSLAGAALFESEALSLDGTISCQSCHLDEFSSGDGLPNAVGTGGQGSGTTRILSGGDVVPRNTLPLWGRGSRDFNVFFWDGKVDGSSGNIVSQFGDTPPSSDPLTVAVHLPLVEIREMLPDTQIVNGYRTETLASANELYKIIEQKVQNDRELSSLLTRAHNIEIPEINIGHIASSITAFIRDEFQIRETRLHQFVFGQASLTETEIEGGLLFYGKARCSLCHNGPFFSDLDFHAIPFGQVGFGRNGFGIDYGRYNVTFDPNDRYKFRTPPLFNVSLTGPYSHSGVTYELAEAIRAHVDPLSIEDAFSNQRDRIELYQRMLQWSQEPIHAVELSNSEIDALVSFLNTLTFDNER